MGLTETELNVIKVFADSKEASSGLVANKIMITPGYAEYLCKCLVKEDYLELTNHGTYRLTPRGREALTGRTHQPLWDQKTIRAIAKELAKHLGGAIAPLAQAAKVSKKTVLPEEPERKAIKIKESFIDPLEQKVKLKHNLSKKPRERRSSITDLKKTLKALKKISR